MRKQIPGFNQYEIDENGNVWSMISSSKFGINHKMAISPDKDGYIKVRVTVDGKRIKKSVHVLACLAFHGNKPSPKSQVRHLDGIKTNNKIKNLCWGTAKENHQDRVKHGTARDAENGRRGSIKVLGTGVGAWFDKRRNKWTSQLNAVSRTGKRIHLGYFDTKKEAVTTYRSATKKEIAKRLQAGV